MTPPPSSEDGSGAGAVPPSRPTPVPGRTLPPPEWGEVEGPRSAASLALDRQQGDAPISRHLGPRAELAFLRARLADAVEAGDGDAEHQAMAALARAFAARGAELDEATKLARRALLLAEDHTLREELAGWFSGLGEPALAAKTLEQLLPERASPTKARLLVRIAVLLGRAGNAATAADLLAQAAAADPTEPTAPELLGGLGAWAPEAVSKQRAARAYVDSYHRRDDKGDWAAAFENLLRAFEMDPASAAAAEQLSLALASRGRNAAADEVSREHARASGEHAQRVHLERMRYALADDDNARALGAALDANLDGELDREGAFAAAGDAAPPEGAGFDEILARVGLHELLAARLELICDSLTGAERSRFRMQLGRLYAGELASPERAADAWLDALVSDPANSAALAALREHAVSARDVSPLVEALVRVGQSDDGDSAARRACLRELADIAEQRLSDPALALWAVRQIMADPAADAGGLRELATELGKSVRLQDEALASAKSALESATGGERANLLRRVAGLLRGRPDRLDDYVGTLFELVQLAPEEKGWRVALERALLRAGRLDEHEALLDQAVAGGGAPRARLALSAARRSRGDMEGALEALVPVVRDKAVLPAGFAMALCLAALLGNARIRAEALSRIAAPLGPSMRAILGSVAAESLHAAGAERLALRTAQQACNADPSLARPTAVQASIMLKSSEPPEPQVLERTVGMTVPRAALCRALADAYESQRDSAVALAWTQRWLALRPGDPEAATQYMRRVVESGDGARLADALTWLLSQPQPLDKLADAVGEALRQLVRLDAGRGAALARRALDVLGPRHPALRDAILGVSDQSGERGLGIALLERWLASGADDRAGLLLDIASRRKLAGDADGAARALERALREGADAAAVLGELDVALPPRNSDGELALLEARAQALSSMSAADPAGAARAWREVGAARWDLAGDLRGAVLAWENAALLDSDRGIERFARDLVAFGGHDEALTRLENLAKRRDGARDAARVLAVAATVAMHAGRSADALAIAERALEHDPSRTDVLGVAERSAGAGDLDVLERIYDRLANAALGIYGERAVHYRAARQLERRSEYGLALRHGVQAFSAVPGVGVTYVLMARLAERAGQAGDVVQALEGVAAKAASSAQRSEWLKRAALFADSSEQGKRQRVEVLLRALAVQPDTETLRALGVALAELVALAPEDQEIVELRYERALDKLMPQLEGPEGARVGIEGALVALGAFESARLVFRVLKQAIGCDASIDEYASLTDQSSRLANEPEAGQAFVQSVVELTRDKWANLGVPLLELGARLATEFDDGESTARLLARAAQITPDDRQLVERADAAARATGDPELVAMVLDAIPATDRARGLVDLASVAEGKGDLVAAIEALEKVRDAEGAGDETRKEALTRLRDLYGRAGRRDDLEQMMRDELAQPDIDSERAIRVTRDLAAFVATRGEPARGLEVLEARAAEHPDHQGLLGDIIELAGQAGQSQTRADALGRLVDLTDDPATKAARLRELAPQLEELGDAAMAQARWKELTALQPDDMAALAALERDAEKRSDWDALVDVLGRRAELAKSEDELRRLRMRRAEVLEQRMGRADEARAELEALLNDIGEDSEVLELLADMHQRLGAQLRAAPLWLRASGASEDGERPVKLARQACHAYLRGGDVHSARRVADGMRAWAPPEQTLDLEVEIERRGEDPLRLAEVLEEFAAVSREPASRRAELLIEAAQAALAGGDRAGAMTRAEHAARLVPDSGDAQLFARWLAYLEGGVGTPERARSTIAELRAVKTELSKEQRELSAFLIAEALDATVGPGAGMRELSQVHAELGARPLVALGMAERLADASDPVRALPLFDDALGGDLRGVRQRGQVAIRACAAARQIEALERALGYLEVAMSDPGSRERALELKQEIQSELAMGAEPSPETTHSSGSGDAPSLPTGSSPSGSSLASSPSSSPSTSEPRRRSSTDNLAVNADEAALLEELDNGSVEAGRRLAALLELDPERSQDVVGVCRRLVAMVPGDMALLERLHAATVADRNTGYASALDQVLATFDPERERSAPPPLSEQAEQPEFVRAVLFRDTVGVAAEALALVWEGAEHVFRRDPSTYGVTGLERVPLGSPSAVARIYADAARALGLNRTPLFQRRSAGAVTVSVALLSPPAVLVSGDMPDESPELAFHLGAMLAGAMPHHALLFGSPESQARALLAGLALAFGPPRERRSDLSSAAKLAEILWESIPARAQRRLRELCDDPSALDYEHAMAQARRAVHRVGLFVCGDVGVALAETAADAGIDLGPLDQPGGITELCAQHAEIADLLRLATSAEYAETRWQPGRAGRRQPGNWGTL